MVSDPALRWQVERDLLDASPEVWEATRTRIATEGFGARLLALQDADGQWAGGSFFPADYDFAGAEGSEGGQPWTATTWTLNTLREWGLDASALRDRRTAELLDEHSRWDYDDSSYWSGEVDCCITPGHWPMVYGWARTSVASLTGFSSISCLTAGGTASGSTGRAGRRFIRR